MEHDFLNQELLLRLKAGEEQAFNAVYKYYYGKLCAYASHFVPDDEQEEIVQDVMMWLWENRHSIANELTLKSLLFTITKNKCLNSIAHRQIKQRVHEKLYEKYIDQIEDPDFYIFNELMEKLQQVLKGLPEDYRIAFEMNRFEEMSYKEIAEKLAISQKTIAYRISHALKILRNELKDYLPLLLFML